MLEFKTASNSKDPVVDGRCTDGIRPIQSVAACQLDIQVGTGIKEYIMFSMASTPYYLLVNSSRACILQDVCEMSAVWTSTMADPVRHPAATILFISR